MQVSFKNNIFSVTLTGPSRPIGNLREECERKAREIYKENKGLDRDKDGIACEN